MNKRRNILVTLLVVALVIIVFMVIFYGGKDEVSVAEGPKQEAPKLPESHAGRDTQRTDVNKLIADLQTMTDNMEQLNQTMSVLKAENKAQAQALELIKDSAQKRVIERLNPTVETAEPIRLGPQTPGENSEQTESKVEGLLGITPPLNLPMPNTNRNKPSSAPADPNQIVWIEPMDNMANNFKKVESPGASNQQQPPGLVDEVSSKAKNELGLESGKDPRYTIPHGSVIESSQSVTALVGKIPIRGQVQDPWQFKVQTGPNIIMANNHELSGLERTIVEGTAIGNLALRCVTGRVEAITFIFNDGRIVTHRAQDAKKGMGYISDSSANPCVPGELITNAPQVITQLGLLGAIEGAATAYANQQTQTTRNPDGSTGSVVIGDHFKNQMGNAGASGVGEIRKWFTDRMDQYFDVIYVEAGKQLDIHISEEIKIDYDVMGRKIQYESSNAIDRGYMD
ncbi:TIGR03752 family integrating conjugative element protein [Thiomicrospira sp.]|uniref:TIGR03752 family integrating conjugative element protein n=1 Tax=Thiomicrospira sp. TaxID=935 RepID=UPI002F935020